MGNVHKYAEHYKTTWGGFSSALGGETSDTLTTPVFVSAKNYDVVIAQGMYSGIASAAVVTMTIWQATSTAGASSKTVTGASTSFTAANTTDTGVLTLQVRGAELDMASGFIYVGAKLVTGAGSGTEKVSMNLIQGRARFPQATLGS
jgi:hypothetical protein